MTPSLHLRLSDLAELGAIIDQLRAWAAAQGVPVEIQRELHLAVDEIVTNIFRHGYGEGVKENVDLVVSAGENVEIEIRDRAQPFNPLERPAPDITQPPETREIGGLGVYFVRQLMDDVAYTRTGGENRVRLTRRIERR